MDRTKARVLFPLFHSEGAMRRAAANEAGREDSANACDKDIHGQPALPFCPKIRWWGVRASLSFCGSRNSMASCFSGPVAWIIYFIVVVISSLRYVSWLGSFIIFILLELMFSVKIIRRRNAVTFAERPLSSRKCTVLHPRSLINRCDIALHCCRLSFSGFSTPQWVCWIPFRALALGWIYVQHRSFWPHRWHFATLLDPGHHRRLERRVQVSSCGSHVAEIFASEDALGVRSCQAIHFTNTLCRVRLITARCRTSLRPLFYSSTQASFAFLSRLRSERYAWSV